MKDMRDDRSNPTATAQPAATLRAGLGKPVPGNVPSQVTVPTDVTPYATVGRLRMKFGTAWYIGTGTLIAADDDRLKGRLVLTCAHNIWDDKLESKEASEITFAAGFNEGATPFATIAAAKWRFPVAFKTDRVVRNEYALVLLATPIDLPAYATLSTAEPKGEGRLLGIYGWDDADRNMYRGVGRIRTATADQVDYEISTKIGASGTRLSLADEMAIVGIHCRSATIGDDWNIARRVTADLIEAVKTWQAEFLAA